MEKNTPRGRFGIHGGQYIPETLMNAVIELEAAYNHYKEDPQFQAELNDLLNNYAGRPSRLYYAKKMKVTPDIFLIRQDKITELFRLHCVENSTIYSIRRMCTITNIVLFSMIDIFQ